MDTGADEPDEEETHEDSDQAGCGEADDDNLHPKWQAPSVQAIEALLPIVKSILRPPRNTGRGYKDPGLNLLTRDRLESMRRFLQAYTTGRYRGHWVAASLATTQMEGRGLWHARRLREWSFAFANDQDQLPQNIFGAWNKSRLNDEDLRNEIQEHLATLGKYICAMDVVRFLDQPEIKEKHGMNKTISERTAGIWMKKMGFVFKGPVSAPYTDGHERKDVTEYRQNIFLPEMAGLFERMRKFDNEGKEEEESARQKGRRVVVWFHDESTFYAHDRRQKHWRKEDAKAEAQAKGEGISKMVVDFVSADYGFLPGARVVFGAGVARDGYWTNKNVVEHLEKAMVIVKELYPDEDHVFVFDNATTHTRRSPTAPSAKPGITKGPSSKFGNKENITINGRVQYGPDRKPLQQLVRMNDTINPFNGQPQCLYQADGQFKGMTAILTERGYPKAAALKATCLKFECPEEGKSECCQRRILFNAPDFANQESVLEIIARDAGYKVIILPKFHCELNFIELCWGFAKQIYRRCPPSTKEAVLEANMLEALDQIPIETMRR